MRPQRSLTPAHAAPDNGPLHQTSAEQAVERIVELQGRALGIVSAMYVSRDPGGVYAHTSFGRVVDRLAARCARLYLCVPVHEDTQDESRDYRLQADNTELIPQPPYVTTLSALRHMFPICRAYARVCRKSDLLFVRGLLPYVLQFYVLAWRHGRRPCQWMIGNPVALLRSHRRGGWLKDALSLAYAWQNQRLSRLGRWLTNGSFVCNGGELGELFDSPRTITCVSSTITDDEFFVREDTCRDEPVRILFVGFPRPEKGIQYLIEALPRIGVERLCILRVVGAAEQFASYRQELEELARKLGVAERIEWTGYVPFGPGLFTELRAADVFVLPTLSEGTPRVLVEARANSLPVVATSVGGIPTSIRDGHDGLLVPPKDPEAIAAALRRIISDGDFRRSLIRNGLARARALTVDRFVDRVVEMLEE